MRKRFPLFAVSIFLSGAYAQQASPPPAAAPEAIIRSETRVVLVDVVAVDKKNKFPRDLTQKDFRIWEDGKEQKISSFSLESAGVSPERSSKHYIVLFFDTSSLTPVNLLSVRQDAARFIDSFASPDRYMAVVTYGTEVQILQNFTTDPARLKNALQQMQNSSAAPSGFATLNSGPRARVVTGDTAGYHRMLASLRGVADSIAPVRGRKALVVFSGGASPDEDFSTDIAGAVAACNKANVAVYGVSGLGLIGNLNRPARTLPPLALGFQRGLPGPVPSLPLGSVDSSNTPINTSSPNQNVLRSLASGTGGLILGTSNDLPDALGRIAQEQDEYYLLGYTPAVESPEGSCHTLQVKVDRSGLDVRARKGYCTAKPADPLGGKSAGKDLEARAAANAPGNITVKMQLPWFYSEPGVARVNLAMDIIPETLKFQKINNTFHGEIDLSGVAYKPDGSVAARLSDTIKVNLDSQQQADAFLKTPYHYENTFQVLPGGYEFRMALGSGEKAFGKVEMPLAIPDWTGGTISISGLALSHETRPAAGIVDGLDDSLIEGPHALVSKGKEVILAGTDQFRAGERGFFYFEIYEPQQKNSGVNVRIRILDGATGQQKDDSGPISVAGYYHPGNKVTPILMALPMAGLPAGAYKLEVSLIPGPNNEPITRSTDFELN